MRIRPIGPEDARVLNAHMARHLAESGGTHPLFIPYAPGSAEMPTKPGLDRITYALDQPKWARWFVAEHQGQVVGHISLKGGELRSMLHRCVLGIGIEADHRGQGLGKCLIQTGIDFAKAAESLDWIDLQVFAHNSGGIALYRSLGFEETGRSTDRFRIQGERVDDVSMSLSLAKI